MVCPYSNAGYDKCYVTHLTPENREKAYYFCGGGGQHRSCHIFPELVAKDISRLEQKAFLGSGAVLLPEAHLNHFLFFYQDMYSKMQLFISFLLDGMAKHEKCLYFSMDDYPSQVRIYLNGAGIPSDQVSVIPSAEWYLRDGAFDGEGSQQRYEEATEVARKEGYTGLRVIGDGGTFLQHISEEELGPFLAYEEAMHHRLGNMAMRAICAYDLKGLPWEAFRRLMASHHILATPLTDVQLSFLCHFIPSLDVEEIAYHLDTFEKTRVKLIRREGVGYLLSETVHSPFSCNRDVSFSVETYLESTVDGVARQLVQGLSHS